MVIGWENALSNLMHSRMGGLWDDVVLPPTGINPQGPEGSMTVDDSDIYGALVAVATGTPSCMALFQLPHMYMVGTEVRLHIHYVKDDGSDNAGTVVWEAKWRISPISAVMGSYTSYVEATILVDPGDTRKKHGIASWTIPYDNGSLQLGISTVIPVVIRRNGGTSGVAKIIGMDLHVLRDQLGSIAEASLP